MIGIYKITNLVNEKVYVGQSKNIKNRKKHHRCLLNKHKHVNNLLQNDWDKYGKENFKFEIVEECSEYKLNEREQYWINYYNNCGLIYNIKNNDSVKYYPENSGDAPLLEQLKLQTELVDFYKNAYDKLKIQYEELLADNHNNFIYWRNLYEQKDVLCNKLFNRQFIKG